MKVGEFDFEDDLLKHFVRVEGWLPVCRERREAINTGKAIKKQRRLKYFTFCAVGAIDVLMLDVANVVRPSKGGDFDTVFFFNRTALGVAETLKRIPGSIGFADDFVSVVLHQDAEETALLERANALDAPEEEIDVERVRLLQRRQDIRRRFIDALPFDVLNLDLEGFLFRPTDTFPGDLVRALKTIFRWQQKPVRLPDGTEEPLSGFTFMFTTKVGPPEIPDDYAEMLTGALDSNIRRDPKLVEHLSSRTGIESTNELRDTDFDAFFKLSLPKLLNQMLLDEDWYVDPALGVKIYDFKRPHTGGEYTMLHLVLEVKRQQPTKDFRAPGQVPQAVDEAYRHVVERIFLEPEIHVTEDVLDVASLEASLAEIKSRRRKYCQDCD